MNQYSFEFVEMMHCKHLEEAAQARLLRQMERTATPLAKRLVRRLGEFLAACVRGSAAAVEQMEALETELWQELAVPLDGRPHNRKQTL